MVVTTSNVIKIPDTNKCAVICGNRGLLVLDRIEIDGKQIEAVEAIRSVRQRLGLDLSSEISDLWLKLESIEDNLLSKLPKNGLT